MAQNLKAFAAAVVDRVRVASARDIVVATALLAFSGWIYIQRYLTTFGLSPDALSISAQSFVYYSFRPYLGIFTEAHEGMLCALLPALAPVVIALMLAWFTKSATGLRTIIVYAGVFASAWLWSTEVARSDAAALARGAGTRVSFVFDPTFHAEPATVELAQASNTPAEELREVEVHTRLIQSNESGHLRVLWRTSDALVVVDSLHNAFEACAEGDPAAYRLPKYCAGRPDARQVPFVYIIPHERIRVQRTLRISGATGTGIY